ncbi:3-methyl-2-oxobutanoate hydroxymethyltransferase [soil metagenome]
MHLPIYFAPKGHDVKAVLEFAAAKAEGRSISMVTCYDSTSAMIVASSNVDCILVGDSVAMTMHGFKDTLNATPEMLEMHVAAVRRGAPEKFVVADLPFLAHRGSLDQTLAVVARVMRAGANAVKIEGVDGSADVFKHIVQSGVPVMGHLGLTPQSVHQFGGFKVQGKTEAAAEHIRKQAKQLEDCGVFAVVLECVPAPLAKQITMELHVPTIGIGAGVDCGGQVLVFQDVLGLNTEFRPKFVRQFAKGAELFLTALNEYDGAVKEHTFPAAGEAFQ